MFSSDWKTCSDAENACPEDENARSSGGQTKAQRGKRGRIYPQVSGRRQGAAGTLPGGHLLRKAHSPCGLPGVS
ncbi:MAG: hypothetical protein LBD87_06585 [Prevotellaceae bacterium]|nr:hypothetical protein [Prevotellaceae bacterium]